MLRGALIAAGFAGLLSAPAFAADAAEALAIGYSADGRYFAFEQFGIQDGSGSAFSDIFVIDIQNNAWAEGTPIRRGGGEEESRLADTRRETAKLAAPLLAKYAVDVPVAVLAATPATQVTQNRAMVQFDRYYQSMGGSGPVTGYVPEQRFELRAEATAVAPQPADCTYAEGPVQTLTLKLTKLSTSHERIVYADTALPKSRGCPESYDIDKVVAPADDSPGRPVAIIGIYTRGFEGMDRRYIAVPILVE